MPSFFISPACSLKSILCGFQFWVKHHFFIPIHFPVSKGHICKLWCVHSGWVSGVTITQLCEIERQPISLVLIVFNYCDDLFLLSPWLAWKPFSTHTHTFHLSVRMFEGNLPEKDDPPWTWTLPPYGLVLNWLRRNKEENPLSPESSLDVQ